MLYGREFCRKIEEHRSDLEAAFQKAGLNMKDMKITYGDRLTVKIELSAGAADQSIAAIENLTINAFLARNGLPENIIGKTLIHRNTAYRVVSVNPSKPKNSLSIERIKDGKRFVCAPTFFKMAS